MTVAGTDADSRSFDGELVGRVLGGDRGAYAQLIEGHQQRLFSHAFRMTGDSDVAADLVQDAFIKGFSRLKSCNDPNLFGAWVFRILRNRTLDYLKNRRRSEVPLEKGAYSMASDEDPSERVEASEIAVAIEGALATLPDTQREAFILKHVEDQSYEEMSDELEVSVSALKMRVMRARESLQAVLEAKAAEL